MDKKIREEIRFNQEGTKYLIDKQIKALLVGGILIGIAIAYKMIVTVGLM